MKTLFFHCNFIFFRVINLIKQGLQQGDKFQLNEVWNLILGTHLIARYAFVGYTEKVFIVGIPTLVFSLLRKRMRVFYLRSCRKYECCTRCLT